MPFYSQSIRVLSMDCIYEVNLEIDNEIAEAYRAWLAVHIPEVVKAGGFSKAIPYEREKSLEPEMKAGCQYLTVHYYAKDKKTIESYLLNHGSYFRAEAHSKFGERFRGVRRILIPS